MKIELVDQEDSQATERPDDPVEFASANEFHDELKAIMEDVAWKAGNYETPPENGIRLA